MTYWYVGGGSVLAAIAGFVALLYRKYKASLDLNAKPFRSFVIGTIKLRLGSVFSKVLASQLAARRYAEIALRRFPSTLPIPSVQNFQLNLDRAYVQLSVTTGEQTTITDEELLGRSDRLQKVLIFGEPGSGKSTLTKKLFRETCIRLYRYPRFAPLPVHIELRSLPWEAISDSGLTPGAWLQEKIKEEVDSVKGVHSDGFVFRAFSSGHGVIVLLDGLDEVPSSRLELACDAIAEAQRALSSTGSHGNMVLVTGRTQLRTTLPRSFLESFDDIVTVEPFSSADVFQFLRRWPYQAAPAAEASRIFRTIQASSSLQEMCTNPLVLSMYVARDQLYVSRSGVRPVRLPDTRTGFYQEIVSELLLFRRGERVEGSVVGSKLRRTRERALGSVALEHLSNYSQSANSIPWELVVKAVSEEFLISDDVKAEMEVRRLAIETGIISEERPVETIRFLHLTLCEFLAALEVRELGNAELYRLVRVFVSSDGRQLAGRLTEVLVFAASLVGRTERANVVRQLMTANDPPVYLILRIGYENHEHSKELLEELAQVLVERQMADGAHGDIIESFRLLALCIVEEFGGGDPKIDYCRSRLRKLVADLTISGRVTYSSLFDAYLRIDPEGASAEANRLGLEELLEPSRLLRALDDPSVVEFAIESFMRGNSTWGVALAEAALRHRMVAEILSSHPPVARSEGANSPREARWRDVGVISGSAYGDILDFATSQAASAALPKLRLISYYGPSKVAGGLETTARSILNLGDRYSFAAEGEHIVFTVVQGRDVATWAVPIVAGLGTIDEEEIRARVPGVRFLVVEAGGDADAAASCLQVLISSRATLTKLSAVIDPRASTRRRSRKPSMRVRVSQTFRRLKKSQGGVTVYGDF